MRQHASLTQAKAPLSVALTGVWAGYRKEPVLKDLTFSILPGDFVGVIGPNGCGKTTLLKLILGLVKPVAGQVFVGGMAPDKARKRVGYLPQLTQIDFTFPLNAWDVVMMGRYGRLGLGRPPGAADRLAASAALERVGLSREAKVPIGQLSGGQRQRAFIARAIACEPDLLILDEPITGVDITTQHALSHLLEELNGKGMTIITTTHDLNCVASSFNRVICLNRRLVAMGSPAAVFTEQILDETFGSHLLVPAASGRALAVHGHPQKATEHSPEPLGRGNGNQ